MKLSGLKSSLEKQAALWWGAKDADGKRHLILPTDPQAPAKILDAEKQRFVALKNRLLPSQSTER